MLGSKRIGLVKEPIGQNVEITKKKATVSASLNRTSSQKIKENTSSIKKSATSCSLTASLPSRMIKTQNRQLSPVKQIKKPIQSNITVTNSKTPRILGNSSRSQVNVPKTSIHTPSKINNINITKEKKVDIKPVNKNKAFKSKTESRLSVPLLHPVALIRDESKAFKQKLGQKNKKPQTATLTPRTLKSNSLNTKTVSKPTLNSSSTRLLPLSQRDIDNVDVCLVDENRISSRQTDMKGNERNKFDMISNRNNYCSEICNYESNDNSIGSKQEPKKLNEAHSQVSSEDICLCNLKNDLISENTEENSDDSEPNQIDDNKVTFNEVNRGVEKPKLETNYRSNSQESINDTVAGTSYFPSFYRETLQPSKIKEDKVDEYNSSKMIQMLSDELFTLSKDSVEAHYKSIDFQNLEAVPRDIKQSMSATTMESSFDTKTFILEKPYEIPHSGGNFHEIDLCCEKLEKLPLATSKETETLNIFKQINLSNEFYTPLSELPLETIPKIEILEDILGKEVTKKSTVNKVNEVENCENDDSEDSFNCVDTLEVLKIADDCDSENNFSIADDILLSLIPEQRSEKVTSKIYDADDEFASESEDVAQTIDIGESIWMDYKMPLNKPKTDDDGELWILGEETDESSHGDVANENTIVLLDHDEEDWIITEKRLDDLRACLNECKEEAKFAAREINRLTIRNNSQLANRKRSSSSVNGKNTRKSNNCLNINSIGEPNESFSEPNYQLNNQQTEFNRASNPCVIEDEVDYYSVSSGEEICNTDVKPQKSYLSFGKSCVKMKKKNDKKVFLSFFNLFK